MTRALARRYRRFLEGGATSTRLARTKWSSPVIDLAVARDDRRLRDQQKRLRQAVDANRSMFGRLYHSGAIFSRAGARLGRELLLAHQHLLRASDLMARLEKLGLADAAEGGAEAESMYAEIGVLLARAAELSARTEAILPAEP